MLHLAASTSEHDVEAALSLFLETQTAPTFDDVRALVREPAPPAVPQLTTPRLDLRAYDTLLRCAHR